MEKYILTLEQDDSRSTIIFFVGDSPTISLTLALLKGLHTVSACISLTVLSFLDQEDQEKHSGAGH